jgi:hypothetical protein
MPQGFIVLFARYELISAPISGIENLLHENLMEQIFEMLNWLLIGFRAMSRCVDGLTLLDPSPWSANMADGVYW